MAAHETAVFLPSVINPKYPQVFLITQTNFFLPKESPQVRHKFATNQFVLLLLRRHKVFDSARL